MGIDEILKLIEILQETDVQELEVAKGDWKVRIARVMPAQAPQAVSGPPAAPVPAAVSEAAPAASSNSHVEIVSPMVGTFYRSAEPDADPFVNENDKVVTGQTMCIIEAMKLMNPIPSEIDGRVVEILVDNAQPVEYGQPLFLLEPV